MSSISSVEFDPNYLVLGAIYMEAGLDKAQQLFGEFLWETPKLKAVWRDLPLHPLQVICSSSFRLIELLHAIKIFM